MFSQNSKRLTIQTQENTGHYLLLLFKKRKYYHAGKTRSESAFFGDVKWKKPNHFNLFAICEQTLYSTSHSSCLSQEFKKDNKINT